MIFMIINDLTWSCKLETELHDGGNALLEEGAVKYDDQEKEN